MTTKAKLRKRIRRLKRENLQLIIESNAARARAGEAQEALSQWPIGGWTYQTEDGEWRTLSHG